MAIKPGVDIAGIQPEIIYALGEARWIYESHGVEFVWTGGKEGEHGRGSLHYVGLAADIRTNTTTREIATLIRDELKEALGEQYDVVLEPSHIHIEFQPK